VVGEGGKEQGRGAPQATNLAVLVVHILVRLAIQPQRATQTEHKLVPLVQAVHLTGNIHDHVRIGVIALAHQPIHLVELLPARVNVRHQVRVSVQIREVTC
jgi:hypothetical protein